jgi:hypothetical protein
VAEGAAAQEEGDLGVTRAPSVDVPDTSASDLAASPVGVPELSDEEWEAPWQSRQEAHEEVVPETPDEDEEEVTSQLPNLTARRRGRLSKPKRPQMPFSAPQKLLLLDTWQRSGLPARDFAALVNVSHHTLYAWKRRFEQLGPAGLMDQPKGSKRGSRQPPR